MNSLLVYLTRNNTSSLTCWCSSTEGLEPFNSIKRRITARGTNYLIKLAFQHAANKHTSQHQLAEKHPNTVNRFDWFSWDQEARWHMEDCFHL